MRDKDPSGEAVQLIRDWMDGRLSIRCNAELLSDDEWEAASISDKNDLCRVAGMIGCGATYTADFREGAERSLTFLAAGTRYCDDD